MRGVPHTSIMGAPGGLEHGAGTDTYGMRVGHHGALWVTASALVAVAVAIGWVIWRGSSDAAAGGGGTLTTSQRALALRIAHLEANGSVPDGSSSTVGGWPTNVQSVEATIADSRTVARFVGGSTASKGQVLVIRLFGNFAM